MKKIALELQPCCWDRSGIGTYTYEIAKRITDQDGMQFHGNLFNFLGKEDIAQKLEGITMPVAVNSWCSYGMYRRLWRYLPIPYRAMFPEEADLSVFFNFIVPPRIRGHVITAVHDLTYLRYPETMKPSNLTHLKRGIAYSVQRSDRIVTVSEFSKREIQELLAVPQEKIEIVYNAPSLPAQAADYDAVCRKFGIRGEYLLFVGTIEPRKNIERLLRAFDRLKTTCSLPHQLVLAGGKGWQDQSIFSTAHSIRYADDVVFTGYVSGEEKNTLYQRASCFVFPSIYEGFGIPPLEAMCHGCPVVCSNAASLPEVVGDAAELVDPFDEENIAAGILRVLSDEPYRQKLAARGYEQAGKFSWEGSARRLTGICGEVLGV